MIAMIGLMIWAYTAFRMIEILARKTEYVPQKWILIFLGVACLLITSFSCMDLMFSGKTTP